MAEENKKTRTIHARENLYDVAKKQTYSEDKYNAKGKLLHKKGSNIQEEFKKSMASGGGTPIGEGEASPKGYKDQNGRGAMQRIEKSSEANQERSGNQQPRTDDGQFTFNSAAGKGLSKKSDPSRNHTVNPLLTDGQNNVDREEFLKQLKAGKGELYEAFSKWRDEALVGGGKYAYQNQIYTVDKQTVLDEMNRIAKNGQIAYTKDYSAPKGYEVTAEAQQKMGRKSEEEKRFIKENQLRRNVFSNINNTGEYLTKREQGGVTFGAVKLDSLSKKASESNKTPFNYTRDRIIELAKSAKAGLKATRQEQAQQKDISQEEFDDIFKDF